jgi:hypothetical protein
MREVVVSEIVKCRLCNSEQLKSVVDLGDVPITSYFPEKTEIDPPSAPLVMVLCEGCGLIQLLHSVNQDFLFGNTYGYRTGLNTEMKAHVEKLAIDLATFVNLSKGDSVLDIGSNDATFLNVLSGKSFNLVGIDPNANDMSAYYDKEIRRIPDFFSANLVQNQKFKLITSVAMFYDVENPVLFAKEIESILLDDGIWFFEQSYALTMFQNNSFDTICHEHLMYYTISVIEEILSQAEMKIVNIVKSNANGGSIGVYASKKSNPLATEEIVQDLLAEEKSKLPSAIANFKDNIAELKTAFANLINELISNGNRIWGIGASTKGNTILSFLGILPGQIEAIADKNELKFGRVTPGTRIPIVSKDQLESQMPEYAVVLPWHFKNSICENESNYISKGGTLIFPLPKIELISSTIINT